MTFELSIHMKYSIANLYLLFYINLRNDFEQETIGQRSKKISTGFFLMPVLFESKFFNPQHS